MVKNATSSYEHVFLEIGCRSSFSEEAERIQELGLVSQLGSSPDWEISFTVFKYGKVCGTTS